MIKENKEAGDNVELFGYTGEANWGRQITVHGWNSSQNTKEGKIKKKKYKIQNKTGNE